MSEPEQTVLMELRQCRLRPSDWPLKALYLHRPSGLPGGMCVYTSLTTAFPSLLFSTASELSKIMDFSDLQTDTNNSNCNSWNAEHGWWSRDKVKASRIWSHRTYIILSAFPITYGGLLKMAIPMLNSLALTETPF